MFELSGKVALVTGAATGLGQAIAVALARNGADLAISDKLAEKLIETEDFIKSTAWRSDFDRPVFFVKLRERYICCWCEMHNGQLILIASPQSPLRAQHIKYPMDATIIGRVTGVKSN